MSAGSSCEPISARNAARAQSRELEPIDSEFADLASRNRGSVEAYMRAEAFEEDT